MCCLLEQGADDEQLIILIVRKSVQKPAWPLALDLLCSAHAVALASSRVAYILDKMTTNVMPL